MIKDVGVEKLGHRSDLCILVKVQASASSSFYVVTATVAVGWLRKRTSRLMF